jgi:hypothetical protein
MIIFGTIPKPLDQSIFAYQIFTKFSSKMVVQDAINYWIPTTTQCHLDIPFVLRILHSTRHQIIQKPK